MRRKPRSITLYLFTSVIIVLLLINSLAIISANWLAQSAQENIVREHTYAQSLYVDSLDRELTEAQKRINLLCNSYAFYAATSQSYRTGEKQYEALRCQTELSSTMKEWLTQFPLLDGYFIYHGGSDVLVILGDDVQAVRYITKDAKSSLLERDDTTYAMQQSSWQMHDTPLGQMMLIRTVRGNACYGAWLQVNRIWSEWGLSSPDEGHSYAFITDAKTPSGAELVIDVPSKVIGCILRQSITSTATSITIPNGILLLEIVSIITLCALPLVWLALRRLVVKPLQELSSAINHIQEGDLNYRIPEKASSSEFVELNRQFNQSIEHVARARLETYEAQLDKEKAQVRYLTQQIQPHFVLNTLNLLYSLEPSQFDLMQEMIQCLSRYFRYIAHINEIFVPLSSEIEHVHNYFKLQQLRYPGFFFYEIECPEALQQAMIPPLIIQTFAENAIKHSLTVGERNQVSVTIDETVDSRVHIRIRDSGVGFPEHILEQIHAYQQTNIVQPDLGIGIRNAMERLHILYKEGAEISFGNAPSGGAEVDILLPERSNSRKSSSSHNSTYACHFHAIQGVLKRLWYGHTQILYEKGCFQCVSSCHSHSRSCSV